MSNSGPVIVFSPQNAVNPQSALLGIVARTLQDLGNDVHLVFCNKYFEYCSAMRCHGLGPESSKEKKDAVCSICVPNAEAAARHYKIRNVHYLDKENALELVNECSHIIDKYEQSGRPWIDFTHNNISLGKMAAFDATISLKSIDLDESSKINIDTLSTNIRDSLLAYLTVEKLAKKIRPALFVFYNDYSVMHSAAQGAVTAGAKPILITHASHRNVDFRKLNIFKGSTAKTLYSLSDMWKKWKKLALTPMMVKEVEADILQRLSGKGTHIFSSGITRGTALFPPSNASTIVAFTSSPDEVFAGLRLAEALGVTIPSPRYTFGSSYQDTQIKWLQAVAKHCHKRGHRFIIRVHPREGQGHGGYESSHLAMLREALKELPGDPLLLWPDDPRSSYDLALSADLILTCWTSMAAELSRIGGSVLAASEYVSHIPSEVFHPFTQDKNQYFQEIESRLGSIPSLDTIILAFRWWNLSALGGSIDLSDLVFTPGYSGHPEYKLPKEADKICEVMYNKGNTFDLSYDRLAEVQTPSSENDELKAILTSLQSVIRLLCFGESDAASQVPALRMLSLSPEELDDYEPETESTIAGDGRNIVHKINGTVVKRRSPLTNNLISLLLSSKEGKS
jgi:hypothetical protein